ncbi:MAG: hypothetical protein WAT39_14415 [Planctomycetota bacterium]
MNWRNLLPWVLAGALLASLFANQAMFFRLRAEARSPALPTTSHTDALLAAHVAPQAAGERCPTMARLGLTAEQRERIRKCTLTSLDDRAGLALQIEEAAAELDRLLAEVTVDAAEVLRAANLVTDLRSKQFMAWVGAILVVRDVLTPEQLESLRARKPR